MPIDWIDVYGPHTTAGRQIIERAVRRFGEAQVQSWLLAWAGRSIELDEVAERIPGFDASAAGYVAQEVAIREGIMPKAVKR